MATNPILKVTRKDWTEVTWTTATIAQIREGVIAFKFSATKPTLADNSYNIFQAGNDRIFEPETGLKLWFREIEQDETLVYSEEFAP